MKQYRAKGVIEVRPYVEGEDLAGVTIMSGLGRPLESLTPGDVIARVVNKPQAQWFMSAACLNKFYEPIPEPPAESLPLPPQYLLAAATQPDRSLALDDFSSYEDYGWVRWSVGASKIELDGEYTADELRALAEYMDRNTAHE